MRGTNRSWPWAAGLALTVGGAIVGLGAQAPRSEPRPDVDRQIRVLDGRGSRLGVMVRDLEPAEAASSGGVRIDEVESGSPAERAGLRTGDIVVEYDGERVRSARQFTRLVQETAEGRSVPVAVVRGGERQSLSATPEARAFSWNMDLDGDRIRREVERGMRGLREFGLEPPALDFRFDGLDARPARGRLGVTLDTLTEQLADYFGASDGGALVTSVAADSPAARAGLKAGDVITAVNGTRVRDAGDVAARLREADGGQVTIGYLRDRQAGTAQATIEPRTDGGRRRPVRPAAFLRPA